MARWASLIDFRRSQNPVLLVDAGDFCRHLSHPGQTELDESYFLRGMKILKYDAAVIGVNEIFLGKDELLRTADRYDIPLLSTNIVEKKSGQTLGAPWIIKTRGGRKTPWGRSGGIKVGIIGLALPVFIHGTTPEARRLLEVENPRLAALEAASILRKKGCALIVAISHQGWNKSVEFGGTVPGIDIVINGRRRHSATHREWAGGTLVVDTGVKNRSFTEIKVEFRGNRPQMDAVDSIKEALGQPERADLAELEKNYQREKKEQLTRSMKKGRTLEAKKNR
ncbi:MAG: bifunctional metallophosphatase/5'-nucleotidase [Candidatus Krumholzibacteriota bacterium]|nr:bifunctional metallophosphatase/5'-nucleotidase [Candidatus Krumholzibacteriota bacterium]